MRKRKQPEPEPTPDESEVIRNVAIMSITREPAGGYVRGLGDHVRAEVWIARRTAEDVRNAYDEELERLALVYPE